MKRQLSTALAMLVVAAIAAACAELADRTTAVGGPIDSAEPVVEEVLTSEELLLDGQAEDVAMAHLTRVARTECVRVAMPSRPKPDADDIARWSAETEKVQGSGFAVEGGPWASGQVFVGTYAEAVAAYEAEAVGALEGGWLITTRDGKPVALQLRATKLPNGREIQRFGGIMVPVDCPTDVLPEETSQG